MLGSIAGTFGMLGGITGRLFPISALSQLIQAAGLVGGIAADVGDLTYLYQKHRQEPEQVSTPLLVVQAGLTLVFGLDRQLVRSAREVFRLRPTPSTQLDQIASEFYHALLRHDRDWKIRQNPYFVATALLKTQAEIPFGLREKVIESAISRNLRVGNEHVQFLLEENLDKSLDRIATEITSASKTAMLQQNWGDLLELIGRKCRTIYLEEWRVRLSDVKERITGIQWLQAVRNTYRQQAARAGQKVGVELEFDAVPGRYPMGWDRDERLSRLRDHLREHGHPEAAIIEAKPYVFSGNSSIFPYRIVSFSIPQGRDTLSVYLDYTHGSGDGVFFGRIQSQSLGTRCLTIQPTRRVGEQASLQEITAAIDETMQAAYREVSRITEVPLERIARMAEHGPVQCGFFMKDDTRQLFYVRYEPQHQKLHGVSSDFLVTQTGKTARQPDFPEPLTDYEAAHSRLKQLVTSGQLKMAPRNHAEGISLEQDGRSFALSDKNEHQNNLEMVFDPLTPNRDDMQLLRSICRFLQREGAKGSSEFTHVALQAHGAIPVTDATGQVSAEYLVRMMKAYYRQEGLFRAALPTGTHRSIFINEPIDRAGFLDALNNGRLDQGSSESTGDWILRIADIVKTSFVRHYSSANWGNIVDKLLDEARRTRVIKMTVPQVRQRMVSGRTAQIPTFEYRACDSPEGVDCRLDPDAVVYYAEAIGALTFAGVRNLSLDLLPPSRLYFL